jgi:hypothetical protein
LGAGGRARGIGCLTLAERGVSRDLREGRRRKEYGKEERGKDVRATAKGMEGGRGIPFSSLLASSSIIFLVASMILENSDFLISVNLRPLPPRLHQKILKNFIHLSIFWGPNVIHQTL